MAVAAPCGPARGRLRGGWGPRERARLATGWATVVAVFGPWGGWMSDLVGGLRHHEQSYSLPGAAAYLGVIIPLTTVVLVLPSVTSSSSAGTLTAGQAVAFSVLTLGLSGVFLAVQTRRHREFVVGADDSGTRHPPATRARVPARPVDRRAVALSGVLIALIIFT